MPAVSLRLRLSDNALTMLDVVRVMRKNKNGSEVTREDWCFRALRDMAGNWTARWNLLQTHGHVAVDPQGQVDIPIGLVPELAIGDAGASANLTVEMPDVLLERIGRAARMNVAVRTFAKAPVPWHSVTEFAQHHLHDAIALARSQAEDDLEQGAVELLEKRRRFEAERERHRAQVLSGEGSSEPESEAAASPVVVAGLSSDGGSSGSGGGS